MRTEHLQTAQLRALDEDYRRKLARAHADAASRRRRPSWLRWAWRRLFPPVVQPTELDYARARLQARAEGRELEPIGLRHQAHRIAARRG